LARIFVEGLLTGQQINATVSAAFIQLREQFRAAMDGNPLKLVIYSGNEGDVVSQLAGLRLMSA